MTEMENSIKGILLSPWKLSRIMETEPVGVHGQQNWYFNRIFAGYFDGTPQDLLRKTEAIEKRLGRISKRDLSPRTADIDILLFGQFCVDSEVLKIPHPAISKRRFCIEGLYEIVPDQLIAGLNVKVQELYMNMDPAVKSQKIIFH